MTLVKVEGKIDWKCFRARGGKGEWIAICDSLSLTIQSRTWADLMEDIAETLNSVMKDLLKSNELQKFFQEHGWRAMGPIPSKPANVSFDIPFIPRIADRDSQVALH